MDSFIGTKRTQALVNELEPFISSEDKVLDIGAGSCQVADGLINTLAIDVTPMDVVSHNTTSLPLQIYDGEQIPYEDNTFDTSLLIFVLHHAVNAEKTFREAQR